MFMHVLVGVLACTLAVAGVGKLLSPADASVLLSRLARRSSPGATSMVLARGLGLLEASLAVGLVTTGSGARAALLAATGVLMSGSVAAAAYAVRARVACGCFGAGAGGPASWGHAAGTAALLFVSLGALALSEPTDTAVPAAAQVTVALAVLLPLAFLRRRTALKDGQSSMRLLDVVPDRADHDVAALDRRSFVGRGVALTVAGLGGVGVLGAAGRAVAGAPPAAPRGAQAFSALSPEDLASSLASMRAHPHYPRLLAAMQTKAVRAGLVKQARLVDEFATGTRATADDGATSEVLYAPVAGRVPAGMALSRYGGTNGSPQLGVIVGNQLGTLDRSGRLRWVRREFPQDALSSLGVGAVQGSNRAQPEIPCFIGAMLHNCLRCSSSGLFCCALCANTTHCMHC